MGQDVEFKRQLIDLLTLIESQAVSLDEYWPMSEGALPILDSCKTLDDLWIADDVMSVARFVRFLGERMQDPEIIGRCVLLERAMVKVEERGSQENVFSRIEEAES